VDLREQQGDNSEALIYAEESYNLVAESYNPVHYQVQKAAGIMIDILIRKGDLADAERFSEMTYMNLRDKKNGMDQESIEMSTGSYNLAMCLLLQKGDLVKAEKLSRESIRLRTLKLGMNHPSTNASHELLARILGERNPNGDEAFDEREILLKTSLVVTLKNYGPDGRNNAVANKNIGVFYYQRAHHLTTVFLQQTTFEIAKKHVDEAIRIYSKIYGPTHQYTLDAKATLAYIVRVM
jgi:hypothetical protein